RPATAATAATAATPATTCPAPTAATAAPAGPPPAAALSPAGAPPPSPTRPTTPTETPVPRASAPRGWPARPRGTRCPGGRRGAPGAGSGGGCCAAAGAADKVGNTILDLNAAPTGGADVSGVFASQGNNIVGAVDPAGVGFTAAGDQTTISAAQLNLGPL